MGSEKNNDIYIQQYLDGELGDDEKLAFEKKMEADTSLQVQVEKYRFLLAGIRFQIRRQNWDKIIQLEKDTVNKSEIKSNFTIWRNAAAWIGFLLVASVVVYSLMSKPENMQNLYAENFSPYPALIHAPVRGVEKPETVEEKAYAAYSNEQYEFAISLFTTILETAEDPLVRFYLGNTYLATGNYQAAIISLEKAIESPMPLVTQARWYLGLSYLAEGRKEEALIQFNELEKGTTTYSEKAKTIINQL